MATLDDLLSPVDVREPSEFATGHLPGAVHVPLGEIGSRAGRVPQEVPLVLYCVHGERAIAGVSLLERLGFGPLLAMPGGVQAWQGAGFVIESAKA